MRVGLAPEPLWTILKTREHILHLPGFKPLTVQPAFLVLHFIKIMMIINIIKMWSGLIWLRIGTGGRLF
jgi:hypothetical protein